jgi:hypothetical protein
MLVLYVISTGLVQVVQVIQVVTRLHYTRLCVAQERRHVTQVRDRLYIDNELYVPYEIDKDVIRLGTIISFSDHNNLFLRPQ